MRLLFKALLAFGFVIGGVGVSAQQVRILVQSSPLAGFQYHDGASLWPALKTGDPLTLRREPDNRHDANAIRIEWQGHMLGYLPRKENQTVAAEMDRGSKLEARIARLKEVADPWQRILVDVYVVF